MTLTVCLYVYLWIPSVIFLRVVLDVVKVLNLSQPVALYSVSGLGFPRLGAECVSKYYHVVLKRHRCATVFGGTDLTTIYSSDGVYSYIINAAFLPVQHKEPSHYIVKYGRKVIQ